MVGGLGGPATALTTILNLATTAMSPIVTTILTKRSLKSETNVACPKSRGGMSAKNNTQVLLTRGFSAAVCNTTQKLI